MWEGDAGGIDPNGNGAGGAADTGNGHSPRWEPTEIVVRGKKIKVDSMEEAINLMQKGARFEEGMAEAKKERERLAQREAELAPILKANEILARDQKKAAKVNAILNDREIPVFDDEQPNEDPYIESDRKTNRRLDGIERSMERLVNALSNDVGSIRRERVMDKEERILRTQFKHASDDDLDEARDMVASGEAKDLISAFKLIDYDRVGRRAREETIEEFGELPERFSPRRSETLNLPGVGLVNDKVLSSLYDDPDRYAQVRAQLREHRRARTGKIAVPR